MSLSSHLKHAGSAASASQLSLAGRVALVTGASEGLGAEIASHLARAGANLLICARSSAQLAELRDTIAADNRSIRVLAVTADVSVPADVDTLFDILTSEFETIDIVVNDAGILGPIGPTEEVSWDSWQATFNTNMFGPVNITRHALPMMKRRKAGKLIFIGGGGVSSPMPNLTAYAASKAAIARFAESIALECRHDNIDVNVVAPGVLKTRMMTELLAAGPELAGPEYHARMNKISEDGGVPRSLAAELCVFLASDLSNGITGKIISAKWDRWREWPEHIRDLDASDVYTLRRITGRDRGLDWGDA